LFLTGGVELLRSGRAAGRLCDTLADLVLKRGALVRHEFSHRIRERKGESEASLQEQMDKWIIDLCWLVSNK
jgi:hypothetical protein